MLNASKQAYAQSKLICLEQAYMLGASLEAGVHPRLAMLRSRMEACVSLPVRPAACERCRWRRWPGGRVGIPGATRRCTCACFPSGSCVAPGAKPDELGWLCAGSGGGCVPAHNERTPMCVPAHNQRSSSNEAHRGWLVVRWLGGLRAGS